MNTLVFEEERNKKKSRTLILHPVKFKNQYGMDSSCWRGEQSATQGGSTERKRLFKHAFMETLGAIK